MSSIFVPGVYDLLSAGKTALASPYQVWLTYPRSTRPFQLINQLSGLLRQVMHQFRLFRFKLKVLVGKVQRH